MNTSYFSTAARRHFSRSTITTLREHIIGLMPYLTVQKILIIASLLLVLCFDIFHIYTDPTFLAPVGLMGFEIGRLLVAVLLLFLLFTEPPRSLKVRTVLGIAAFMTFVIALQSFFT